MKLSKATQTENFPTTVIRIYAALTGFIALIGLLALFAHDALAVGENDGADENSDDHQAEQSQPNDQTNGQNGARNGTGGDRRGFQSRPGFSNPFTAPNGNDEAALEDEIDSRAEEERANTPPPTSRPPRTRPSRISRPSRTQPSSRPPRITTRPSRSTPGGSTSTEDVPDPKYTDRGIEVGGEADGGIKQARKLNAMDVETESGAGPGGRAIITDFNYPDADIMDIAKTLGKLTGKNFILDKDVRGKVTIISNSPITVTDAWKAFLTSLDINGYTLIPSGNFIRIARQRDARDKQLRTYTGNASPDSDQLITRVIPLKHISADEVARTLRSFMPANSRIMAYDQTNTVIITDTGSNIQKLVQMLDFLDVEGYDAGIEVIPVKYASAVELSNLIDTLIPGETTGKTRRSAGRRGQFQARRTKGGGIINTIIADERTNTLIVHANTEGAGQVRELVAQLDKRIPAQIGGGRIHVIYLQFADAEKIATTLNSLGSQTQTRTGGAADKGGIGINPKETKLFEGAIKVSADKATNSLVITASPSDLVTVQRVIAKLDIPRDEVYVEAVIMEMSITKGFDFSTNVIAPRAGIGSVPQSQDLVSFLTAPFTQNGVLFGFKSGGKQTLNINGTDVEVHDVQGLVRALQTNALGNVLATPQILTLDNEEATFETAEKIPVPTTQTGPNGVTTQSISSESISLKINIKPQINKISNFVKLKVVTTMADISQRRPPAQVQDLAFATIERNADTTIVVADGDTAVIGGLVRDSESESVAKVPLLGDIPILGWLFSARSAQKEKKNMLVFITPHIIRHYERVRRILDKKLKERDDFIEDNAGGEDPHRNYRDNLIRSLPDIKTLTQGTQPDVVNGKSGRRKRRMRDQNAPPTANPSTMGMEPIDEDDSGEGDAYDMDVEEEG